MTCGLTFKKKKCGLIFTNCTVTGSKLPVGSHLLSLGQYNGANCNYDYENGIMAYDVETSIDKLLLKLEMVDISERSYPMIPKATVNITAADCPSGGREGRV